MVDVDEAVAEKKPAEKKVVAERDYNIYKQSGSASLQTLEKVGAHKAKTPEAAVRKFLAKVNATDYSGSKLAVVRAGGIYRTTVTISTETKVALG